VNLLFLPAKRRKTGMSKIILLITLLDLTSFEGSGFDGIASIHTVPLAGWANSSRGRLEIWSKCKSTKGYVYSI